MKVKFLPNRDDVLLDQHRNVAAAFELDVIYQKQSPKCNNDITLLVQ